MMVGGTLATFGHRQWRRHRFSSGVARDSRSQTQVTPKSCFLTGFRTLIFSSQPDTTNFFFKLKKQAIRSMFLPSLQHPHIARPDSNNHTKKETVVLEPTTPFILSRLFFTISASHECLTVNRSSNSEFKINRINQSITELEFKIGGTHSDLCRLQISLCSLLAN